MRNAFAILEKPEVCQGIHSSEKSNEIAWCAPRCRNAEDRSPVSFCFANAAAVFAKARPGRCDAKDMWSTDKEITEPRTRFSICQEGSLSLGRLEPKIVEWLFIQPQENIRIRWA